MMTFTSSPILLWAIGAVFALLITATVIVQALIWRRPERDYTELSQRVNSWWLMVSVFSISMLVSSKLSVIFMAFLSFMALKEFFTIIPTRRTDRRVLFWAYLTIPMQFYLIYIGWYTLFIIFIPIYAFFFITVRMVLTQQTEGFLRSTATIHWLLMITVYSLGHAAYLMKLPPLENFAVGGAGLMFYLVLIVQLNDVAQYVWGKSFGKHKILPIVSPKKTWEGFLGGVFTSTLVSLLVAQYLTPFTVGESAIVGAGLAVLGFLGDVTISAIKRDLGVKDTGRLLPGHGGIMDRIDSLTLTAPLFFHVVWYWAY